jgi:PKD repeat protein
MKALTTEGGDIVLVGSTNGTDLPVTDDAPQGSSGGSMDAFVAVLSGDGDTLLFCTYLGGSGNDHATDATLDDQGVLHVVGATDSTDFPTTEGCYQPGNAGYNDAFAVKLDIDDGTVVYSTLLGGSHPEALQSGKTHWVTVNVNSQGKAWLVGFTYSADFPVTPGCYQVEMGDEGDIFVSRLSVDGIELEYSTYLGGYNIDAAFESRLDDQDRLVLVGVTDSGDFPVTEGAYQSSRTGYSEEGFIARFSSDGKTLEMSTFIGGTAREILTSVEIGTDGDYYFAGYTDGADFPATTGVYQKSLAGNYDAVAGKLSEDGGTLEWATYLGGSRYDMVIDLCLLDDGSLCLLGYTHSDDFPTTPGAFQDARGGNVDATVSVLTDDGTSLLYSSYLGGVGFDLGSTAVAIGDMTVLLAGWTNSPGFPVTEGVYDADLGIEDAYVALFALDVDAPVAVAGPDLQVDQGDTVVLDGSGSWDDQGITRHTWTLEEGGGTVTLQGEVVEHVFHDAGVFNVTLTVEDAGGRTAEDGLTVTVRDTTHPVADAGNDVTVDQGANVTFDAMASTDNVGIASYEWWFIKDGATVRLSGPSVSFRFFSPGRYNVFLEVIDDAGWSDRDSIWVTVLDIEPPVADAGGDRVVDQGQRFSLNGMGSTDNVGIAWYVWTDSHHPNFTKEESTFELILTSVGEFTFTLTVRDASGNEDSDSITVTVRDTTGPSALPVEVRNVDQGDEVILDGSPSTDNVGIASWQWSFVYDGLDQTLDGENVSFKFDTPGDYPITLLVSDAVGLTDAVTFDLHVRDTQDPVPPLLGDVELEVGQRLTINASGASDNVGIVRWSWSFQEDHKTVVLEGEEVEHVFYEKGEYVVTLTLYDAEGNLAKETFTVTVTGMNWSFMAFIIALAVLIVTGIYLMRRSRNAG